MFWSRVKDNPPPKDGRRILAYIKFCGRLRVNVLQWHDTDNTWITNMGRNHTKEPLYWMPYIDGPKLSKEDLDNLK